MWCEIESLINYLHVDIQLSRNHLLKKVVFLPLNCTSALVKKKKRKTEQYTCMDQFFDSQFYSIDLHVYSIPLPHNRTYCNGKM